MLALIHEQGVALRRVNARWGCAEPCELISCSDEGVGDWSSGAFCFAYARAGWLMLETSLTKRVLELRAGLEAGVVAAGGPFDAGSGPCTGSWWQYETKGDELEVWLQGGTETGK
jgi:hypothetical protein